MDDISVIIRSKNEERWIGHTIQSCLDLLGNPEIIIVDNNSTDSTLQVARYFAHDPTLQESNNYTSIKIFNIDNYTPGKALNYGVSKASKENILIISSHCVLTKIDFEFIRNNLNDHCCIFGNQNPFYNGKRVTKRYLWSHFIDEPVSNMYSEAESRYFVHNALCAYKRDILIKYPFSDKLQTKEDRYWAISMIGNGFKTLYSPTLSCNHHYTEAGNTWKGIG
tara:strand:- start:778 stop:1446 length:669 start_codon:yes stop_codon:yes gene_type:complete